MTVARMQDETGNAEYLEWRAFFSWRAEERAAAIQRAQR